MLLKNRVALITGGGGALGEAMALEFAREGAPVIVGDIDPGNAAGVAHQVKENGGRAISLLVDVTEEESVKAMVEEGRAVFGKIDILVNNAGMTGRKGIRKKTILEMERSEWEQVLAINLTSVFNCSKAVLPLMLERKYGQILNISSVAAKVGGLINGVHYVAAKAGMIGMTKALAREYAADNIRVNALCLGRIETPLNLSVPAEFQQRLIAQIPLGRLGNPREVAAAAAFMVSDMSSYITGATLDVNGGWLMD